MSEPTFVRFDETELIGADAVPAGELVVGATYEAIGPAHGSKLGPPARVRIVGELEDGRGWRTEAPRQPATVILRQAARYWRRVTA